MIILFRIIFRNKSASVETSTDQIFGDKMKCIGCQISFLHPQCFIHSFLTSQIIIHNLERINPRLRVVSNIRISYFEDSIYNLY